MNHRHIYKYILGICCLLLAGTGIAEAQSNLVFESTTLDFGHIAEDGGVVARRAVAENRGDRPIVVVDVVTACGCTTASYSRKPIAPGESFTLDISYNPMDRPGRIDRRISVITSDSEAAIKIHLVGNVTPRQRSIYEIYPFDMDGGLRLESNFHSFACIEHGKAAEVRIGYVNSSTERIYPTFVIERSSGLLDIAIPHSMAPGESGDIVLRYAVDQTSPTYGSISDHIRFNIDGKASQYLLTTYAVVVDNFDLIDDISAPRLEIPEKNIKFGDVKPDYGVVERRFSMDNVGNTTLVVRRIESSHAAVECIAEPDMELAPGERREVVVRIDCQNIEPDMPFASRLQIVSNDPIRPLQMVRVTALPM